MRKSRLIAIVRHVREEPIRMRVRERPVLTPTLHVVAALDEVEPALIAPIGSGKQTTLAIEGHAKGVSAAFGKQFELVPFGMIPPDCLPEKAYAANGSSAGAALRAIKPAVRPPGEAVGHRVCVLQAKAL